MCAEVKRQLLSRLRRIESQVRGLQRMVEQDPHCIDILTQTASTIAALHGMKDMLMTLYFETRVAITGVRKPGRKAGKDW